MKTKIDSLLKVALNLSLICTFLLLSFGYSKDQKSEIEAPENAEKTDEVLDNTNHVLYKGKKYVLHWGIYTGSGNSFTIDLMSSGLKFADKDNPSIEIVGLGNLIAFAFTTQSKLLEEGTYIHSEDRLKTFSFNRGGGATEWDPKLGKGNVHFAFADGFKLTITKKEEEYEIKFNALDKFDDTVPITGYYKGKLINAN